MPSRLCSVSVQDRWHEQARHGKARHGAARRGAARRGARFSRRMRPRRAAGHGRRARRLGDTDGVPP